MQGVWSITWITCQEHDIRGGGKTKTKKKVESEGRERMQGTGFRARSPKLYNSDRMPEKMKGFQFPIMHISFTCSELSTLQLEFVTAYNHDPCTEVSE
jgi:hypothetical protein